ncbi:MAG: ABC transporter ATP-binding protein [Candidatus Competibacterales bacterium]
MTPSPLLTIEGLSVDFRTAKGPVHALREVSFSVPRGQVVGGVGESGRGKSTVVGAVMGLLSANGAITRGELWFDGQDLRSLSPAAMNRLRGDALALVSQDPMTAHNPVLTVGQQLIDVQYRAAIRRREKRRRAAEGLARVGIPDAAQRLDDYPHQFSGGMRQRLSIAMALLTEPALLIADEPTTALDATLEVQIIELLQDLQRERGCAILFISHHLGVIAELCHWVVVMYAGTVVEQGPVRAVFHRPAHPYTQALLACDPARLAEPTRPLPTIPGEVPDLRIPPPGCPFAPRCPRVFDPCGQGMPDPQPVADHHRAACFRLGETGDVR